MSAYYNEIDPVAAAWLRQLVSVGLIADGFVDERDIRDVRPTDLTDYDQCHFFAGIGTWSYALRLAHWPDDERVWTGSCPCQPFSAAGKGGGFDDERHLWPAWHWLIAQCRPAIIFGEQVASKDGLAWFDLVHADLEGAGYACGAIDLCAAGVGAPHIRQRLWFVADTAGAGREPRRRIAESGDGRDATRIESRRLCDVKRLGDAERAGLEGLAGDGNEPTGRAQQSRSVAASGAISALANPGSGFVSQPKREAQGRNGTGSAGTHDPAALHPTNSFWRTSDWIACRDGRWRPVEPGTFPLAHGIAGRMGRLRGYGNAIVTEAAKEVIVAYRGSL